MSSTPKTPGGTRRAGNPQASAAAVSAAGAAAPAQVPHPPQLQQQHAALAALGGALLDAFPAWTEQHAAPDKEDKAAAAGAPKHEDALGMSLPPAAAPFCDAWKRAEELLQGAPHVPMVCLKPGAAGDAPPPPPADAKKGSKAVVTSRELDGQLFAGHECFEWLLAVISNVTAAEKWLKRGDYLWELVHPKDKEGLPVRSPSGRYRVKLFLLDTWRCVVVDDRIPVDLFGRSLLVGSRPLQLWPLLLCKAILKVMATYRSLHVGLPNEVAAFQMLTGWPQEDLLGVLGGTQLAGGALCDRLEDALGGPLRQLQEPPVVASCCLVRRSKPQRAPPRLLVLSAASGVGRSALIARLLAEFPDKFGVTVSTTSRPPREHEVGGRDYHFTDKHTLLAGVRAKQFLEAARVGVHSRPCTSSAVAASYWYGTSLATVREVAATGKLCVMSLDVQGAEALWSNPRIDGLYLYISTSNPDVLAARQKQRLSKAASTLAKKLAWAKQQVAKASTPALFDDVVVNTSLAESYAALKEAISKLSPIIRNRLRGRQAYVLDYSDLINPNSVEKPFLKPVIVAGPSARGERRKLLEMLVTEFPDVFDFPRQHTTTRLDEHARHVGAAGDELQQLAVEQQGKGSGAVGAGSAGVSEADSGAAAGDSHDSNDSSAAALGPVPVVLSREAFEAAAAAGRLLEVHTELFKHPLAAQRWGHSAEALQDVIRAGKLPLLELEAEEAELVKVTKGVDCLTVFLAPPSLEEHQQRLADAATESDEEVAQRGAAAAAELGVVQSKRVFDAVLHNDELAQGYRALKAAISRFRPDLIPPDADLNAAARAAQHAAASQPAPVIIAGPAGGGRERLVQQLQARFPQRFAAPRRLTDRKPGKADKEPATDEFVKPDVLARLAAQGQVVWSQPDTAAGGGSSLAVTVEGLQEVTGKMAVLDVGSVTPEQLSALHPALKAAFTVYVCSSTVLAASLAAAGSPEAVVQAALAAAEGDTAALQANGAVQALVCHDDPEEAFMQLQVPLAAAFPWAVPPVLQPLVVAGAFGSGKRCVLQRLVKSLPDILAVPKVVTSKPRAAGEERGMEVVTLEEARQMAADGRFLVHQEVLGHVYGITAAAVRRLQAQGKLPLLDLDRVQDVQRLKAAGLQASFVYLQAPSLEALQARITAEFLANPPLYHEPAEAAAAAAAQAAAEVAAAAAQVQLFDAVIQHDPEDVLATLGQLGQQLHLRYPAVVPSSFVWGFGRPLWDPACRVLGLKPLRVVVLGPAASGKSVQSTMLAAKFNIPHVNVGDLLYAAVSAQTPAGLEAQRHMDANKGCVPDCILLDLLLARLQQPDCIAQGWVLDGFPHTKKQAAVLEAAGHVADKAILLEAPHALLLNRVKYRRIDYATDKVFHLAEAGALSEGIQPLRPDGSPDADVLARLSVRHDDSPENVAARLALWDRQVQGLRAAYEDVLLRLPAAGAPNAICARAEAFIRLEASLPSGPDEVDPGNVWPLVESWQLEQLTYRVVATLRYKRQQLVQLQQLDGKRFFVNLKELAPNCSCMLLAHNPAGLQVVKASKRLDTSSIQAPQLLLVDSPEPVRLVACLSMGPQHAPLPPPPAPKQVFVLAGPTSVGRSSLVCLLLHNLSSKLVEAPVLTSRVPLPYELQRPAASSSSRSSWQQQWRGSAVLQFVPGAQFELLQTSHQLAGLHTHMGHAHAVHTAALEAAAQEGRAVLLVGSVHLAEQLRKDLTDTQVVCLFVDADTGSLGQRLRQQEALEEQLVQALLGDAAQQRHKLHALLEQQDEQLREQQAAAASAGVAAAAASSLPQTPGSRGAAGFAGKPTLQLPQTLALRAGQPQPQHLSGEPSCSTSKPWLLSVLNADRQLHTCFAELKEALTRYLPQQQQFQPGLLLVQRCPLAASGADAASHSGSTAVQQLPAGAAGAQTAAVAAADQAGPGLDADVFSSSTTVLRLRALTAASSQLLLPRGRHLLALHCCPRLLHCVSLHSASEFSLEDADKLLPVACKVHVVREAGTVAALVAGSRQLLFRFMLKPAEACILSLDLQASSDALAVCTRLLLLDIATGQVLPGAAAPQMQLAPAPRGYMLLALAEPCVDVPGGSWSLGITSSHRLPPLTEVPCGRQAVFSGTYAANTQAVLARFVISPATAVNMAALAQIQLPASQAPEPAEPHKVAAGAMVSAVSTSSSTSSSQRGNLPLRFSLQVFDMAGAKEVVWGTSYPLLASEESHADGRVLLPNLSLPPGRHLIVLQLQQQDSQQWVNPQTGDTSPPPDWQLQLIPSADDKACPIMPDDARERHCAATMEAWQQEAAAAAAAAGTGKTAVVAAAAAKDRPRLTQAALERHLAEAAAAAAAAAEASSRPGTAEGSGCAAAPRSAKAPAVAVSSSHSNQQAAGAVGTTVPMPPSAARRPPATTLMPLLVAGATAADSTRSGASTADAGVIVAAAGQLQQWPGTTPAAATTKQPTEVVPRQLKGTPDVLQLSPADKVKWIKAVADGQQTASRAADAAADAGDGIQVAAGAVLAAATNNRRQLQAARAQLQADQAAVFQDLRSQCQAEQLSVLARKRQVIEALAPTPLFATAPPATASATHGPQAGSHGGSHKAAGGKSSSRA